MEDLSGDGEGPVFPDPFVREAGKRFPRGERLKGRDEIREVFNRGRAFSCPGARLLVLKNKLPHNRIAFVFSRKFGGAVERNRARRVGREAYRHLRARIKTGYDLVLLVYPGKDNFQDRMEQLQNLLSRAALVKPPPGRRDFV